MFTERQVKYVVDVSRSKKVFAHLAATGTIIQDAPGGEKRPYYYALILAANSDILPAFPLLEFISTCHNVNFLLFCLNLFVDATKNFLEECDTKPVIDKIEVDWTLALMQSTSRAFNNMSLLQYLKFVWININKNTGKIELNLNITVIHICSSHLINAVKKRSQVFTSNGVVRRYQNFVLSSLIHTTDLNTAASIVIRVVKVFGLKSEIPDFFEALTCIQKITDTGEVDASEDERFEIDEELKAEDEILFSQLRHQSPFHQYFEKIISSTINDAHQLDMSHFEKNKFFCPQFLTYLLNEIHPLYPLMSGIVIRLFGIKRDTNNAIENWMGFVKNVEFGKKLKI